MSIDRSLVLAELRRTVHDLFLPELTSPEAVDAAALVDRILVQLVLADDPEANPADVATGFAAALGEGEPGALDGAAGLARLRAAAAAAVAAEPVVDERGRRLLALERELVERADARRVALAAEQGGAAPAASSRCSVTAEQLTAYLRRRFPGSPGLEVTGLTVLPGGRSKETILVELRGTTELPAEVVLRKDRPVGLLQTKAADELAVLRAVYDFGGVPVAEPFFAEAEGHGLGEGTFEVMARVPGAKAGEYFPDLAMPPPEHRAALGAQLGAALGRLHSMPLDLLDGTGLAGPEGGVRAEAMVAAVEGMATRLAEMEGPALVSAPVARHWLIDHVDLVAGEGRVCLLQGDVGLHNTLVDGAQLTALVDWEGAAIGPPARELANVRTAATALMPWGEFLDAYIGGGGSLDGVDDGAITWYRLFAALGAAMISRQGAHLFATGAKRDLLTAHSGLDSQFRNARNLARVLEEAMAVT